MDLKSSAENVTMHGFGRISTTKSLVARLFWLVLMLGFSSMCAYQLLTIISLYFSNSSIIKEEKLIVSEIDFPSVTICGPAFSKWKLSKFAEDHNLSISPSNESLEGISIDKELYGIQFLENKIVDLESLEKIAIDEDEFLLKRLKTCKFNYEKCNYTMDFEKLLVLYRSYCYRFNKHGRYKQRRAGSVYGFDVILFLNVSDTSQWSFFDIGDAVEIIIQNPSEYPFVGEDGIFGKVGHLSQIDIRKTEIRRLKSPYPSNCTNGENARLLYPGKYTSLNCMESCIAYASAKECKAAVFHNRALMPNPNGTLRFLNEKEVECYQRVEENIIASNFSSCNCNLPCHETKFYKSASYSQWPATADLPFYKKVLSHSLGLNASSLPDEFVRRNFLRISISFSDMTYRRVTEEKQYTPEGIISDIGGQMGIWLGASMFSVFELFFLLFQFVRGIFMSKGKESKEHTLENPSVKID